jgi:hypothetical protein
MDGSGNQRWLLVAAIRAVAGLVQTRVPTLVACSAGLSRSPSLAAAGIALATGVSPTDALRFVIRAGPADLSPGLWADVLATLAMLRALPSGTGLVPRSDPANDPE